MNNLPCPDDSRTTAKKRRSGKTSTPAAPTRKQAGSKMTTSLSLSLRQSRETQLGQALVQIGQALVRLGRAQLGKGLAPVAARRRRGRDPAQRHVSHRRP